MRFIQGLKSLDDLLYEVITWVVFYPVTLWRSVRHPLHTMQYARNELGKEDSLQFRDTLRPPVFLLVTVILAYVVEIALVGESAVVTNHIGIANLIDDNQSMMIMRIFGFALFPVIMASVETSLGRKPIDRDTLEIPFHAQCFLAAPFVLALSLAITAIRGPDPSIESPAFLSALAISVVYIWMEGAWLARSTGRGWGLALPVAIGGFSGSMLILWSLDWLLAGH
jgi:hypothetical protein